MVNSLNLRVFQHVAQSGVILNEKYKIDLPMCFVHVIGQLSTSSSRLKVDVLCGLEQESSEFSLVSPTKYVYNFKDYQHIEPEIIFESKFCIPNLHNIMTCILRT